ncbi:RNA-guided endonuclease InsQ/TnpB family protein [Streptomyces sp. NPDC059152]|uniref:RNA-guided endonuclease InsQ/TnpB family protein n=1 Tax=Streptomyces sp. NPDC059152 TaxID=3346742 RepID=UPI00369ADA68
MTSHVKRAFRYRFYPTDAQAAELSRTFGCVRKVYNMALEARTRAWQQGERINYSATSAMLTAWKKTQELAYLSEVSSVPLQQCLRHLQGAFTNFWEKRGRYPRFKSRKKSRRSAEYTSSAFRYGDGKLMLAKMKDPLNIAVDRWFPSSKLCSTCGSLQGKMPLHVRVWTCSCGTTHDRDVNAAKNLLAAGRAVTVCGAGVRPQRRTPVGQSAMKQKPQRREP